MSSRVRIPALALATAVSVAASVVQAQNGLPDTSIDGTARKRLIATLVDRLEAGYVFPEKVGPMADAVRGRLTRGEYDGITSSRTFADSVTRHLQAVSHDKHLRVFFNASGIPAERRGPSPDAVRQRRERAKADNYGIGKPERLDGNVAYLEIRTFGIPPEEMGDALAEAMSAVADAGALIIDVRNNGGGSPFAVALVSSYLFGPDSVHLNSLYFRPANRTDHFWTRASVPGKRFGPTKPLYVLTSDRTFSAAEEFAYNLQTRKRAVIVGDTTGGGAHPGGMERLDEHFGVFVPTGRAINPITKTNWEGTGIRPEMPVPTDEARDVAHKAALAQLRKVRS